MTYGRTRTHPVAVAAVVAMIVGLIGVAAPAQATPTQADDDRFAELDDPGPDLTTPEYRLDDALHCYSDLSSTDQAPVLLVHGTTFTTESNFEWNWIPALQDEGIPVCGVDLHEKGMADMQRSAENVVHAIRVMHERSGEPVRIVGYSQGGIVPRFALRFWPDLRDAVSELVTLAGPHNGTQVVDPVCLPGCGDSLHQFDPDSDFIAAVNSRAKTYPGIEFTSIYTRTDQLVVPSIDGSAPSVDGWTNIALQDVCPTHVADHIMIGTIDPVAYALARDALNHSGTANPDRIPASVCTQVALPGVDLATTPLHVTALTVQIVDALGFGTRTSSEPPLRCYVTGSCG